MLGILEIVEECIEVTVDSEIEKMGKIAGRRQKKRRDEEWREKMGQGIREGMFSLYRYEKRTPCDCPEKLT